MNGYEEEMAQMGFFPVAPSPAGPVYPSESFARVGKTPAVTPTYATPTQPGQEIPVGVGQMAGAGPWLEALLGGLGGYLAGGIPGAVVGAGAGLATAAPGTAPAGVGAAPGTDVVPYTAGTIVGGVPIAGPGVPEPPAAMVSKYWKILVRANDIGNFWVHFWRLIDGRVMCYNGRLREWKIWRPKKHIVISRDPRMSTVSKLERTYRRVVQRLARKSRALSLSKGWGGRG